MANSDAESLNYTEALGYMLATRRLQKNSEVVLYCGNSYM